jgi:molybdopterin/thiamine biosynthesis adenylyltransferase
MSTKVGVVGAGGIGSWLLDEISRLQKLVQIPDDYYFTIFDDDTVERKNLTYQNFGVKDVLEKKVHALAKRYDVVGTDKRLTVDKDLSKFDVIICSVDNPQFRRLMFRYMEKHLDKFWIDLRAESRVVVALVKSQSTNYDKLIKDLPEGEMSTSCQLEFELSAGILQLGNRIAATIGAQYLLNFIRGDVSPDEFIQRF